MSTIKYISALSALNFSAAVKELDIELKTLQSLEHVREKLGQVYYNRGFCLQRLGLLRKALKDFDAALRTGANSAKIHCHRGQVLHALGRMEDAKKSWQTAIDNASFDDDADDLCAIAALQLNPNVSTGEGYGQPKASQQTTSPADQQSKESVSGGLPDAQGAAPSSSNAVSVDASQARDALSIMQPHEAVGLAVEKVNLGRCSEAEEILNGVLQKHPKELGAWVARGTARALLRKLEGVQLIKVVNAFIHAWELMTSSRDKTTGLLTTLLVLCYDLTGAVQDFSVAIDIFPQYPDTWKRRGQAKCALGDFEGALSDLQKCVDLSSAAKEKSDPMVERAMVFQKIKDFRSAVAELDQAISLNDENAQAWNMMGLCKTSLGDIEEGVDSYKRTLQIDPDHREAWFNMFQALKEAARVKEAEQAYQKGRELEDRIKCARHIGAYRVLASMYQGMGQHQKALDYLDEALDQPDNDQELECYFLRAACYHAIGRHASAIEDYSRCLDFDKRFAADDVSDRHQLVVLAFYQKELALYVRHKLDEPISNFCMDRDISPVFKELWCKKVCPTSKLVASYAMQSPLPSPLPVPPPAPDADAVDALTNAADSIGRLLQNAHQGFLPNRRQHRAAGLAVIELAQAVCKDVELMGTSGTHLEVNANGASGGRGKPNPYPFGWRDAMDVIVKWRQLSEPNDQVVWVDLLTPSEFEAGFGSHTPMFSGQTKCARYYMNFHRALNKLKEILLKSGRAFNAQNEAIPVGSESQMEAIRNASTASEMYNVIKEDSWVVVPIHSMAQPEAEMEGTRLTLVKVPNQPDAFEFSIRTPVTPGRWALFEEDLTLSWANVISQIMDGTNPEQTARCILTYAYYWYNFMPLARGTAASGHSVMLALFWAAGMAVTSTIPSNYQIDWEAILEQHPEIFVDELCHWMVPDSGRPEALRGRTKEGSQEAGVVLPNPSDLPRVAKVLPTTRDRIEALNGRDAGRI